MYRLFLKRFLDFIVAFICLLILLPVILVVGIILIFANKGNPFFLQKRPGKNEKIFSIIKFKTMNDKKGKEGHLLPDEERLTKAGKAVRKASLDEIPQLINVLIGNMSLIGPRPLRIKYLKIYNEEQKKRHLAKPGITGWAQINGRNQISWTKKFELDVWYVENMTLWLDIKIFLKTLQKVVKAESITKVGYATTEPFNGKN